MLCQLKVRPVRHSFSDGWKCIQRPQPAFAKATAGQASFLNELTIITKKTLTKLGEGCPVRSPDVADNRSWTKADNLLFLDSYKPFLTNLVLWYVLRLYPQLDI